MMRCRGTSALWSASAKWAGAMLALWISCGGSLHAQNRVFNGDFDVDVAGWEPRSGGTLVWTDLSEATGCPNSGMGLSTSVDVGGMDIASVSQCVGSLTPGQSFAVRASHLGYGTFSIEVDFLGTIDCESGLLTGVGTPFVPQDPAIWGTEILQTTVPANAFSARVRLVATDFDPHGLGVDGVVVSARPALLLDGFEADDAGSPTPCRWN